jgi:hypothetical protein
MAFPLERSCRKPLKPITSLRIDGNPCCMCTIDVFIPQNLAEKNRTFFLPRRLRSNGAVAKITQPEEEEILFQSHES